MRLMMLEPTDCKNNSNNILQAPTLRMPLHRMENLRMVGLQNMVERMQVNLELRTMSRQEEESMG